MSIFHMQLKRLQAEEILFMHTMIKNILGKN